MAHLLALIVGLGSFALYMAAFFYPEVHRKNDFLWSGVGMFYGLVLWFCAGRVSGALMLGQMASVSLIVWLGWQTLSLRRSRTPVELQTPVSASDVQQQTQQALSQLQRQIQQGSGLKGIGSRLSAIKATLQKGIAAATSVSSPFPRITKPRRTDYEYAAENPQSSPPPPPAPPNANPFLRPPTPPSAPPSSAAVATPPTPPSPSPRRPVPATPNAANKLTTLKDWLGELLTRKPKPKQTMIELPPRPPSIPRPPKSKSTAPPQKPQPPTADIIDAEIIE
ncbi:Ycf66 family protein [Almyronema epifaneia]|uniref:Ycf66 family protein n=1 Tax=Almyronema epifaneia S1 TaxID=2991925 RepID=A0ABW6IC39_9CYAN